MIFNTVTYTLQGQVPTVSLKNLNSEFDCATEYIYERVT